MKTTRVFQSCLVCLALIGLCLPLPLLAAPATPILDIAMQEGGLLQGQVVDLQNQPRANVPVALVAGEKQLAVGRTNANGYFAFQGVRGGVYQLATPEGFAVYRVWTAQTAPPSAQPAALLVTGNGTVRGQCCGGVGAFLSNPWVIAGIIATAIAVPIAVHNADDDEPVSP